MLKSLMDLTSTNKFQLVIGLLTLSSVVLALVLYIPEIELSMNQIIAIYIFDLIVVAILVLDFCVRTKRSGNARRYVLRHFYEIPAMLPLLVLGMFEDPLIIGAAVRSIRLLRLLRLMRLFRLLNLFRTAEHWRLSTFVYLSIILASTVIFGAVAILAVEEKNENITDLEDALWFAVTTITISGFGDVYPLSTAGRIIAAILSFVGLAIILGFISNVGASLVVSRLSKSHKRLEEETKELIRQKINSLEQLHEDEIAELLSTISRLYKKVTTDKTKSSVCLKCQNNIPLESSFCNICGQKLKVK